ncbi:hypothetical protein HU200_025877 [Digitaria exilis]|uniref:non-specific serine/threonine protein kinase n=1 Tax=Digitaria exilis TaxID=1010633 RepID=A0A835C7N1_9POAL|nr:hypothetical protein HU200_025877 [Digitaria exilis]
MLMLPRHSKTRKSPNQTKQEEGGRQLPSRHFLPTHPFHHPIPTRYTTPWPPPPRPPTAPHPQSPSSSPASPSVAAAPPRPRAMGNCCSGSGDAEPAPTASSSSSSHLGSGAAASSHNGTGVVSTTTTTSAPTPTKPPAPIGPVLGRPMEDVRSIYTVGKELGRGQFGVTSLCTHKATGERFACKTIAKRKLSTKEDVEDVRREVQIMYHLAGQPNIVELKGAYEDKQSVHLVMELCAGGELFDRIIAKGKYTERAAAALLRTIVEIVHTCHSLGVIHRDLKPENFLLLSKDEKAPLKATDFGLSVFFKQGEVFKDIVGSAYYIAPEVLKRSYGPEADIWSIGHGIFNSILRGQVDFSADPWPRISPGAKDLVKKMLTSDTKKRISAYDVLSMLELCYYLRSWPDGHHPWIKEDGEAPDTPLDNAVMNRLKQFRAMNQFKKAALRVIAGCLSEEEIRGLKEMFKSMDADNSGTITVDELRRGLAKQGTKLTEDEVEQLMEAADADGNGTIDYEEFITATMHMNRMDREEHLYTAFQYFDKDGSGYLGITDTQNLRRTTSVQNAMESLLGLEELEQALKEKGLMDGRDIMEIISEVDADNDGRIDYSEFVAMMRKGNPEQNPKKRRDVPARLSPLTDRFRPRAELMPRGPRPHDTLLQRRAGTPMQQQQQLALELFVSATDGSNSSVASRGPRRR